MSKSKRDKPARPPGHKRVRFASYPAPSAESAGQAESVMAKIGRHANAPGARAALDKRSRTASYEPGEPVSADVAPAERIVNPATGLAPS